MQKSTENISHNTISNYIVKNSNNLKRYARQLTYPHIDEADDLFQETVYRCLKSSHMYAHRHMTEAWIKTIMHNIYINSVNSAYHRTTCYTEHFDDTEDESSMHDECYTVDELYRAIEKLDANEQQIIIMRIQGYSYEEIAEATKKKIGTIKSTIFRIKRHIKEQLKG